MRLIFKGDMAIVIPEDDADAAALDAFAEERHAHLFRLTRSGRGMQLVDLGEEDIVRNTPINITSQTPEPFHLISNFAHTPFTLDDRTYASVEGFWQALKLPGEDDRRRVAMLVGQEAKLAVPSGEPPETFEYDGKIIRVGTFDHWQLMRRACLAKFSQHTDAREALLATGERPLMHKVRHDSRTIPGVVMADIWVAIRARLRKDGAAQHNSYGV